MIKVQQLSKQFGTLNALDQVNLECEKGSCIALIGPNGCGKTTLIKCILGMVIPTKGNILFQGQDISMTFKYREHIGYMPQIGRYPEHMTIGQIIEMMKEIRQSNIEDEELMNLFKLNQLFNKKMRKGSRPQKKTIKKAETLLLRPVKRFRIL